MYESFKSSVLGKILGDGQCVAVDRSYTEFIYPKVDTYDVMPQVTDAYQLANKSNQYVTWVENNHSDVTQLPSQGNIMVFGPTPETGYTDDFDNPAGHTGICDSATSSSYHLLAQNSPVTGDAVNVTEFSWKYRPCLGWYTLNSNPTPPSNTTVVKINVGTWNVRTGAGTASSVIGIAKSGQEYGPAAIMSNGWAQITFTGKTGYVAPSAYTKVS